VTTADFIEAIHGNGDGHFVIFEKPENHSRFFTDSKEAAAYALERSDAGADVYVGVGQMAVPPDTGRGKLEHITGLGCLWVDIDIAGPTHENKSLPPTESEALKIIQGLGPQPTLIVRSGTGLHAWWLFKEFWTFDDEQDKAKAIRLARRWNDTVRSVAQGLGYDADPVKDLTRVLRVVGTKHQKTGNLVKVIQENGTRYEPDDFEQYLIAEEYSGERPTGVVAVDAIEVRTWSGATPDFITRLCENDTRFQRIWERTARDMPDQSGSSYDMALANMLVARGHSDQEVADAIVAWRSKHGDKPEKALRRDYLSRTIGKAKVGHQSTAAFTWLVNELPKTPILTDQQKKECFDRLSEMFQRRVVAFERILGEMAAYTMRFADPEATVHIGPAAAVLGFEAIRNVLFDQGVILSRANKKRWDEVASILLRICTDVEDPEGSLTGRFYGWLGEYIRACTPSSGENWHDCFIKNTPAIRDGQLYIHANHFEMWLRMRFRADLNKNITIYLNAAGFKNKVLAKRIPGEKNLQARYWQKPLDDCFMYIGTGFDFFKNKSEV